MGIAIPRTLILTDNIFGLIYFIIKRYFSVNAKIDDTVIEAITQMCVCVRTIAEPFKNI